MTDIKEEDIVTPVVTEEPEIKPEGEQDPLKTELERVKKGGRTQKEKLLYTKKRIDEQLREIDGDDGVEPSPDVDDDDAPVTVGMLKQIQAQTATKTALQLADEISNETERELVKHYINNIINSTGNPKEDLRLARALANDVKNKQILEQVQQRPGVKRASANGGGQPYTPEEEELSADETAFMKPPFNLSKDKILEARKITNRKDVVNF
jgi:hypothetical protein